ncbi:MAG: hypothetical protein K2P51_00650 [Rhabdochlamydiaceae bacterium]|nr:hypothetical protein [Rhabdochlamydiaceae bacterium]
MKRTPILCLLLLLFGCAPNSLDDFRHEGESRTRALIYDLQQINSREVLMRAEPNLKKHFEKLVDLMIEARQFQLKNPDLELLETEERTFSLALKEELRRIYRIEGGREVMERAQQEALVRLDAYERARLSKK